MIRRSLIWSLGLLFAGHLAAQNSPVKLTDLSVEHAVNPIGIGDSKPRLSWKLDSTRKGEVQTAYEIRAASSLDALKAGKADLWSSDKVASDQSALIPWGGSALGSRAQVFWQVRVWDKDGTATAWSDPASFELGLLSPAQDWKGQWITVDLPRYDIEASPLAKADWISNGGSATQATGVRYHLQLPANAKVIGATIDVSADGLIALYVNGVPTRQGSTSHTAPFHADFGPELTTGNNLIAIISGAVRRPSGQDNGNAIAAHGQVDLDNGQHIDFYTDGSWKSGTVPNPGATGPSATAIPAPDSWPTTTFDESTWAAATDYGKYSTSQPVPSADSTIGPGRYLRKAFTVKGPIAKARLYSTAFGVYEASINGQRVNDHQLDPGFTDYNKRVMVQTTDVTALLKPGANAIGALIADGWFAGRLGWDGLYQYKTVSDHPLFNAQLEITYADGSKDVIATDNTWKGGTGDVVGSDDQLGEVIDARKALPWDQATFNDSGWANATVEDHSATELDPQVGPPVRRIMELAPKKITKNGNSWIIDFGQNLVGHVKLTARGPANTVINVTHAEMLNADGSLYTENLRSAISLDTFTLKGTGAPEVFEPHFTFHGFRYAEIDNYPGELTADNVRGIVVGSDTPNAGTWESSSADINQLYSNIRWGQRGNYISIPTDCPQRDERMGWMGDAQVFAPTAARNSDVAGFFAKWTIDIDDAQTPQGRFSSVSPKGTQNQGYPVWGDAGVLIPWLMYNVYGDKKFLADHYDAMAKWVDYCQANANSIMTSGVGDHLAPTPTPTVLVDRAYFTNSADIVAKSAALLGKTDDAAKYSQLHDSLVADYQKNYIGEDGSVTAPGGGFRGGFGRGGAAPDAAATGPAPRSGNTQGAYVFALHFNLAPENLRPLLAQRLAADIEQKGHLTTGFPGTGWLCPTLTQIGRSDLAWKLLFTDTYPSWLFEVKNGATTMWERWDGWTEDNGFQASSMNSFNHYSFGAVGYWLYTGAAGIMLDDASPGYKHFIFAPQFTDKVSYVKSSLVTPYGKISSYWHVNGDQMVYDVTVPPNSSATLNLPIAPGSVKQDGQTIATTAGATSTSVPLVAGSYSFSFPKSLLK